MRASRIPGQSCLQVFDQKAKGWMHSLEIFSRGAWIMLGKQSLVLAQARGLCVSLYGCDIASLNPIPVFAETLRDGTYELISYFDFTRYEHHGQLIDTTFCTPSPARYSYLCTPTLMSKGMGLIFADRLLDLECRYTTSRNTCSWTSRPSLSRGGKLDAVSIMHSIPFSWLVVFLATAYHSWFQSDSDQMDSLCHQTLSHSDSSTFCCLCSISNCYLAVKCPQRALI